MYRSIVDAVTSTMMVKVTSVLDSLVFQSKLETKKIILFVFIQIHFNPRPFLSSNGISNDRKTKTLLVFCIIQKMFYTSRHIYTLHIHTVKHTQTHSQWSLSHFNPYGGIKKSLLTTSRSLYMNFHSHTKTDYVSLRFMYTQTRVHIHPYSVRSNIAIGFDIWTHVCARDTQDRLSWHVLFYMHQIYI